MPILVINKAEQVATGSFWVLAVLDDTSSDQAPLDIGYINNKVHIAAMNYARNNSGVIAIHEVTPIGASAVNFDFLQSQEKSLLIKY